MKKVILLLVLVILMVFSTSINALGVSQVYFDYIADGDYGDEGELSGFVLGGDYQVDSIKVGLNHLTGDIKWDDEDTTDYTQTIIKGGYGFAENAFVTLSMLNGKFKFDGGSSKFDGILLGGDFAFDITENLTFEGSLGISVSGECENSDGEKEDLDITTFKLKLAYLFIENIGVSLSYDNLSLEYEDDDSKFKYMTIGAVYKF